MTTLPPGTVTFLFTDIQGSTTLWEHHPEAARAALMRHDVLVEEVVTRYAGTIVRPRGEGDSRFAVFPRATDAVAAAAALQQALYAEPWPTPTPLKVRMALHTGEADLRADDYYGQAVNRCARLRAAAHGGQTLLSHATFDLVRDAVAQEVLPNLSLRDLGEHRLKDLIRPEHIHQLVVQGLPDAFPPLRSLDTHRHNLPVQRSALLGREKEVGDVTTLLLQPEVGLVTLTGPGGIGKTRLSLQVGAELAAAFPDGVFFVDLAPITDPAFVLSTIAQSLEVKEASGQVLIETVQAYLQNRCLLLLLDNFEQVVDAAIVVSDLLRAAPRVKVLVTSRFVLHLSGEYQYPVPPLAVPDLTHLPPLDRLSQYASVQLFIQRAQAVKPTFRVTNATAPAVAEICAQLDGLPLAIELAAAHSKVLSPQALLTRLSNRLDLLRHGARDLPVRQQTLRSTIDWSYERLPAREQILFRRLSVFVGGASLEAVAHVCTVNGEPEVLPGIELLVDRSLVRQEERVDGMAWFTMMETLREYALEQLEASGEGPTLQRAHAAYYVSLAEQTEPQLTGPDQAVWLARLELDHDNLRAALAWAFRPTGTPADAEVGATLARALGWFWLMQAYLEEGQRWLDTALQSPALPTALRELLLYYAGAIARERYDYDRAQTLVEESLAMARARGDQSQVGTALLALSRHSMASGDASRAIERLEESLALFQAVGFTRGQAWALTALGKINRDRAELAQAVEQLTESRQLFALVGDAFGSAYACIQLGQAEQLRGDYAHATTLFTESLVRFQALENGRGMAFARMLLGWTALDQGAAAQEQLEESLTAFRAMHEEAGAAWALVQLGRLALQQGELAAAEPLLLESMALFRRVQHIEGLAWTLAYQGQLVLAHGQSTRAHALLRESVHGFTTVEAKAGLATVLELIAGWAAQQDAAAQSTRLFGAVDRLRAVTQVAQPMVGRLTYDQTVVMLRNTLGERGFASAWEAGRGLSLDEAMAEALASLSTLYRS